MSDTAIYVEIISTRGSTPRDAGTVMKVTKTETEGTIGGGALEYQAIARARRLLASDGPEETQTIPLGPGLGQCCGGAVTLRFGRDARPMGPAYYVVDRITTYPLRPRILWLWGAGHVGRAVVQHCSPRVFRITWVDDAADRFPAHVDPEIKTIPAADMPRLATRAPLDAHHLIFTYSHEIDLTLCAALLRRGAASIGLIGSETKWARFRKRLTTMGLDPSGIRCPIGDKSFGKEPENIARGCVRELLEMPKLGLMA